MSHLGAENVLYLDRDVVYLGAYTDQNTTLKSCAFYCMHLDEFLSD